MVEGRGLQMRCATDRATVNAADSWEACIGSALSLEGMPTDRGGLTVIHRLPGGRNRGRRGDV